MKYYFRYSSTNKTSNKNSDRLSRFGLIISRLTGKPVESYYSSDWDWLKIDTDNVNFNPKITYWEF